MTKKLTIAYLPASNDGLSFRGTEICLYDEMHFAETILGHKSILCLRNGAYNDPNVLIKFKKRFDTIIMFDNVEHLESELLNHNVHALYTIRSKQSCGIQLRKIPMLIHCVYEVENNNIGLVSAAVSKTVANKYGSNKFVPHMVNLHDTQDDFRSSLNIPKNTIVFGRHGGADTWDLPMAMEALVRILNTREDIYFIFAVRPLIIRFNHPRLIFLDAFADLEMTRKFVNTCNAMIHAQSLGESFGLSCAEMSTANKPVITWNGGRLQEHLRILGEKCIKYNDADELYKILNTFRPEEVIKKDWRAYGEYIPEKVIAKFDEVFLNPLKDYILTGDILSK